MWMSDRKAELSDYTLAQGPPLLCFSFKQNTPRGEGRGGEAGGAREAPRSPRSELGRDPAGKRRQSEAVGRGGEEAFSVPSCCTKIESLPGPAPTFSAAAHARLLAEATSPARRPPPPRWASWLGLSAGRFSPLSGGRVNVLHIASLHKVIGI